METSYFIIGYILTVIKKPCKEFGLILYVYTSWGIVYRHSYGNTTFNNVKKHTTILRKEGVTEYEQQKHMLR